MDKKINVGHSGPARCVSTYNLLDTVSFEDKMTELYSDITSFAYEKAVEQVPTKKIYLAGPWFNSKDSMFYNLVVQLINFCEGFTEYEVFIPGEQLSEKPFDAFVKNVSNIQDADVILALADSKDVGTAWEIGMGYALHKKIVLVGMDATTFLSHTNVMLAFTGECMEITQLINFLLGSDYKTITIKNDWEGIE